VRICAGRRHDRNRISLGRKERQVFPRRFSPQQTRFRLTVINDVPLEDYVTSVISSEIERKVSARTAKGSRGDFAQLAVVPEGKCRSSR